MENIIEEFKNFWRDNWMLIIVMIIAIFCMLFSCKNSDASDDDELYKITAYCSCEKCCGKWADGIMASGRKCKVGYCACNVFQFGTKLNIAGLGTYEVQDRGARRYFDNQKHIDIYFDSHDEAKKFGVQYKEVKKR